jgi:hypothetical protein
MYKSYSLGGVGGGGEDGSLIILQDTEPMTDIAGVVFPEFGSEFQIGAEEGRSKFSDQFFHCVCLIAKPLLPEFAIEAALMPRPVGLMPRSA